MALTLFQLLRRNRNVAGYYELQPGITAYCRMRAIRIQSNKNLFLATVGMRRLNDTTLPLGSKITLYSDDLGQPESDTHYICKVIELEQRLSISVHHIQLIEQTTESFQRQHERINIELDAARFTPDIQFKTSNISLGGVQFQYSSTLTSAVLDRIMPIQLSFQGESHLLECMPRYIQYNWWDQCHQVGARFINLTPEQELLIRKIIQSGASAGVELPDYPSVNAEQPDEVLNSIIKPESELVAVATAEAEPEKKEKKRTFIDPESGRIRFDR